MAHPGGRPLKFQTVEDLQSQIDDYFEVTPKDEWTWTGLALHLDTDKWTLTNYRDKVDMNGNKFSASIKKALLKVENGYEVDLKKHGRSGTIFALKNFEWRDKTEQDISVKELPKPILGGDSVRSDDSTEQTTQAEETN